MNWTRKHNNDEDSEHRKEWQADRGRYRIVWRNRVFSVSVLPGFQCCVRVFVFDLDCYIWDWVDRKRSLYRTLNAAKTACEKHADPDYKPARKKKRKGKAPMKTCSQCASKIHVRKAVCDCGHKFPRKIKSEN